MATNSKAAAYTSMVAEAEAAVASVKDPELRRVAFDKILATLLEQKTTRLTGGGRIAKKSTTPRHDTQKHRRGPKGYVEELVDDDFFGKQRTIADVKAELANRGHHIALTSLSGPLQSLTQARRLRRMKATTKGEGKRNTYAYSNY